MTGIKSVTIRNGEITIKISVGMKLKKGAEKKSWRKDDYEDHSLTDRVIQDAIRDAFKEWIINYQGRSLS